jgi:hypothetical protein
MRAIFVLNGAVRNSTLAGRAGRPSLHDRQAAGVEGACGRHRLPGQAEEQAGAAAGFQPLCGPRSVVERAWEQKVPLCLLKGLTGLSTQSAALWRTLDTATGEGARQVLVVSMHKFANGDLACSELGWRPVRARVQIQQFAYMWQLMHEALLRTRALHRELAAAPPLTAEYAVGRACTAR